MKKSSLVGLVLLIALIGSFIYFSDGQNLEGKFPSPTAWTQIGTAIETGSNVFTASMGQGANKKVFTLGNEGVMSYDFITKAWTDISPTETAGAYMEDIAAYGDHAYLVTRDQTGTGQQTYVSMWDGSTWTQLGDSLNVASGNDAIESHITIAPNRKSASNPDVYVATEEVNFKTSTYDIYVKWWNGSSWELLGDPVSTNDSTLKISSQKGTSGVAYDNIFVATVENASVGYGSLNVYKWNGTTWGKIATDLDSAQYTSLNLTTDSSNHAYVSWANSTGYVAQKWDGSTWTVLGTNVGDSVTSMSSPTTVDSLVYGDKLYAGMHAKETSDGVFKGYVVYWDGSAWRQLGDFLNDDPSADVIASVIANGSNTPIVAYNARGTISVKRW